MVHKTLALVLFSGLMAQIASAGSALFTSTATVATNSFTTGTVVISTSPASALVTFTNMAPGDQVTAPITVANSGTLQLRYAIKDTATNPDAKGLSNQLVLTIKSGVTTCTSVGFGGSGTQLYTGALGTTTMTNLIGNPAQGQQAGDRSLTANTNEVLCFNVTLPLLTGDTYQNASTTATFTFNAEQTANN